MRWGMVAKFLGKTGDPIKYLEIMYKTVVQEVLKYGSEIWVTTNAMVMVL